MIYFSSALLFLGLSLGQVSLARADLQTDERGFLISFLGLSDREASERFQVVSLGESSSQYRYGEVRKESRKIFLNLNHLPNHDLRLRGTRVHEAIHLYMRDRHPGESLWITEGIAILGEYLFDLQAYSKEDTLHSFLPQVHEYMQNPFEPLETFKNRSQDYGKSLLFFLFLYETFHQTDFIHAYYKNSSNGWDGLIDGMFQSFAFQLTPKSWKDPSVLVPQFYWSLINKRNTLATTVNDQFSQLLRIYDGVVPSEPFSDSISLAPHGFKIIKSDLTSNARIPSRSNSKVFAYLINRTNEMVTRIPIAGNESVDLQNPNEELLLINLDSVANEVKLTPQ